MKQQRQQRWQTSLTFFASGAQANLTWFGSWVWSGFAYNWVFFGLLALSGLGGGFGLFNSLPQAIACKSSQSLCYVLRWDKKTVVLPTQPKRVKVYTKQPANRKQH